MARPGQRGAEHRTDPAGGHHAHGEPGKGGERFYRFDITDHVKTLLRKEILKQKPTLTIKPTGEPDAEAKPVIGAIVLIER